MHLELGCPQPRNPPKVHIGSKRDADIRIKAAGVEFIDENGGAGVRLKKPDAKKAKQP
jgi:hypothetical protein